MIYKGCQWLIDPDNILTIYISPSLLPSSEGLSSKNDGDVCLNELSKVNTMQIQL